MPRITRSPLAVILPLVLILLTVAACQRGGDGVEPETEAEARPLVRAPEGWTWYHNQPMGYTVRLPNNVRIDRERSTRLERFYKLPDGQVEVTMRAEPIADGATMEHLLRQHRELRAQDAMVTNSASGADFFEVESVTDGVVLLEKASRREEQILWLAIRYPEADREAYDEAAATIANSFPDGRQEEPMASR